MRNLSSYAFVVTRLRPVNVRIKPSSINRHKKTPFLRPLKSLTPEFTDNIFKRQPLFVLLPRYLFSTFSYHHSGTTALHMIFINPYIFVFYHNKAVLTYIPMSNLFPSSYDHNIPIKAAIRLSYLYTSSFNQNKLTKSCLHTLMYHISSSRHHNKLSSTDIPCIT